MTMNGRNFKLERSVYVQKWPLKAYIGILKVTIMDFILYNLDRFNSGTLSKTDFWFVDKSAFSLVSLKIKSWKCKSCNYEHFQISTDNSITATLNYKDKASIDYNELLGIYHHNGIITSKFKPGSNKVIWGHMRLYGLFRLNWDGIPP